MPMRVFVCLSVLLVVGACRKPDLVVASGPPKVDLARTGVPGGSLRLGPWTVRNQGPVRARTTSGSFTNSYYLSVDPIIATDDRLLQGAAATTTGNLEPGQTFTFPGDEIRIPSDLTPGTYYFGILVDRANDVPESDESNNAVSVRIGIVREPD